MKLPPTNFQTYFQQKWAAKAATRGYHGEQVREKQWQRMFTSKLNSVIPMTPKYLAEHDGSEYAAGRGSGRDEPPDARKNKRIPVPYMHMTYAPLERRLDMAVWRSLFASSARQARQMCIHGQVKVNGQKVRIHLACFVTGTNDLRCPIRGTSSTQGTCSKSNPIESFSQQETSRM